MDIKVTARKFELNDSLRDFVQDRLGRLERYDPRLSRVDITLTEEKRNRTVEALAAINGDVDVHAEATADDFRTAINRVSDKLKRQLKRRHQKRRNHQAPRLGRDIEPEEAVEGE